MSAGPDRKFGALLHSKRLPVANAVVLGVVALGFLWVALMQPLSPGSLAIIALAAGLAAMVAWTVSYRAWIHDQGVRTSSVFGRQELLYKDLQTFAYSRISRGGQVTDTLTFIPRSGKPVRVAVQPRGQDKDLARIVDVLSATIAARMEQELARQKRARWLTHVPRALPAQPGVLLTREAFLLESGGSTTAIPFADVEVQVSNGYFLAKDRASGKVRLNVPTLAPNFYPGVALFEKLQQLAPAGAAPVPAAP